ncbi:MAG: outer membrane beta-barrel protein [Bacteroidales bacterium]|nr:outer membrane beta-barrel protein [Bacteroidales bacterium]
MRIIITFILAAMTLISASAYKYTYNFHDTPISQALVKISKEHPELRLSFIYKELDHYKTSAKIRTDNAYDALRAAVGVNPVSVVRKDNAYYVEALQHGRFTLTGQILDTDGEPIVSGVVYVLSADSDRPLTYGLTDGSGRFSIPCDSHDVKLRISYLGYKELAMRAPASGVCGILTLRPQTVMLGEVVVKSNRPATTIKGDALVTTVAGTQLEHAGTADDVLTQVPMVFGRDGNFEVFGKGAPAIYVNGRLVRDTNDLLQINSADITTVEVVTNPGAKYDASVRSVIRIRTKRPQGEGFSGTLRTSGRWHRHLMTINQVNLKYRTGALEVFANFGMFAGKFQGNHDSKIVTHSESLWEEKFVQRGYGSELNFFGKGGFSYLFNDNHSIGAYYVNGFNFDKPHHEQSMEVWKDGELYDRYTSIRDGDIETVPQHSANLYYSGKVHDLTIDFNTDYLWHKTRTPITTVDASEMQGIATVSTLGVSRSRMFAEKLVLSYPIWNGLLEVGEEYVASRFSNNYSADTPLISANDSRVDERNIAAFVELHQSFGGFHAGVGLRYEHIKFDYLDNGLKQDDQSKTYSNLFPSLSLSKAIGPVQLSLSYTDKTQRPSYRNLDGTVDYVNRITLESGNPYLQPEHTQTVELMGSWRKFFGQLSYSYKKDPIMRTSQPYGDNSDVKLLTYENFPKINYLQAFIGSRFNIGVWEPSVNLGIRKQWLTVETWQGRRYLNNPMGTVQWMNAIHLPLDIWLNVDLTWKSAGNDMNSYHESCFYVNAKLYKALFHNSFSISLQVDDVFNTQNHGVTMISRDVTNFDRCADVSRRGLLTLQYTFNTSRDRYRGKGAGTNEKNRF